MKNFASIVLLVGVAIVTLGDAKIVFPVTRDAASDAYIDQVIHVIFLPI